jgi:hypothetical protein
MERHVGAAHGAPGLGVVEDRVLGGCLCGEHRILHLLDRGVLGFGMQQRGAFDDPSRAIDVDHIGDRRRGHRDAPVRHVLEEPLLGESAERLAQCVARDAEVLGDGRFRQP